MEFLAGDPTFNISLTTVCGTWLLVLADFLPKARSIRSTALMSDSWLALVALAIILLSYLPAGLQFQWSTHSAYAIGAGGLLLYLRLQPTEFSLWKTPAKRLLTIAVVSGISLMYTILAPSADYVPMIFAYMVLALHRRAIHSAVSRNVAELDSLAKRILVANAELRNYAALEYTRANSSLEAARTDGVFKSAKTEGDFLRKTG